MSEDLTIDPRHFRDMLGHYASGITVVTGIEESEPVGFTCQSFYSVSIDPPLVSFSVMRTSTTYPRIARHGKFAINVLAHDQGWISTQFARTGTDKWAGISWETAASGNPVIADTLMWVDCELWAEHEAGDHLIVIGRVVEMCPVERCKHEPLLFFKGAYRHLGDLDQLAS
jgi:flavin reductase (DIM6/NTAB) family NADH-FMN oxidoreductase RutF